MKHKLFIFVLLSHFLYINGLSQDNIPQPTTQTWHEKITKFIEELFLITQLKTPSKEELCHSGDGKACLYLAKYKQINGDKQGVQTYLELACILGIDESCRELQYLRDHQAELLRQLTFEKKLEEQKCLKKDQIACRKLATIQEQLGSKEEAKKSYMKACELKNAASCLYLAIEARKLDNQQEAKVYQDKFEKLLKNP